MSKESQTSKVLFCTIPHTNLHCTCIVNPQRKKTKANDPATNSSSSSLFQAGHRTILFPAKRRETGEESLLTWDALWVIGGRCSDWQSSYWIQNAIFQVCRRGTSARSQPWKVTDRSPPWSWSNPRQDFQIHIPPSYLTVDHPSWNSRLQ